MPMFLFVKCLLTELDKPFTIKLKQVHEAICILKACLAFVEVFLKNVKLFQPSVERVIYCVTKVKWEAQ